MISREQIGNQGGILVRYNNTTKTMTLWCAVDQAVYNLDASSAIADEIIRPIVSDSLKDKNR